MVLYDLNCKGRNNVALDICGQLAQDSVFNEKLTWEAAFLRKLNSKGDNCGLNPPIPAIFHSFLQLIFFILKTKYTELFSCTLKYCPVCLAEMQ